MIAPAMAHLGHDWEAGRIDVMHEHRDAPLHRRAARTAAGAGGERREGPPRRGRGQPGGRSQPPGQFAHSDGAPRRRLGCDHLGPHTPLASFCVALGELNPRLVWLSVSYLPDPQRFLNEYWEFYKQAERAGVAVAVGGRALEASLRPMPSTFHGAGLTELAAFGADIAPAAATAETRTARRAIAVEAGGGLGCTGGKDS